MAILQLVYVLFQSTPSAWRETEMFEKCDIEFEISIHSLRMEGDDAHRQRRRRQRISIHSLRMEGDGDTRYAHYGERGISIHSLRMEGDSTVYIV